MLEVQKTKIPSKYRYLINGEWFDEDDMAEHAFQHLLTGILESYLRYILRFENCLVTGNILLYPLGHYNQRLAPDVMFIKEVSFSLEELKAVGSWEINPPERPIPSVVFEVSSESTWTYDVQAEHKPDNYSALGIPEYFAFDPAGLWVNFDGPLRGWRTENGQTTEIQPDENGWLWSDELNSWLVPEGYYLRLYDAQGNKLLSEPEEHLLEVERRQLAEERAEQERIARQEAEQAKIEAERVAEQRQLEAENRIAELERQLAELKEKNSGNSQGGSISNS